MSGQKLATYQMNVTQNVNPPVMYASQTGTDYYFGGKLIKNAGGYVGADRLGSIGHFYPYGQEKPSATQNGTEKFTGYFRDAETGLDYADQRYHNPGTGRFLTPDPYHAAAGGGNNAGNPSSWNKYAYGLGDPVQFKDPHGLFACTGDYDDSGYDDFASECGWDNEPGPADMTCPAGTYFVAINYDCEEPAPAPAPPPKRTYFLAVTKDCYDVPSNGGPVTREIDYQLRFNEPGMPRPIGCSGAVVWEHLTSSTGTLPISGANSPSAGPPGTFDDTQSIVGGSAYQQITQNFSAATNGSNIGLGIDAPQFGGWVFDLNIQKYSGYVSINGNTGGQVDPKTGKLIPGTYTPCN